jgi:hypothetical protein
MKKLLICLPLLLAVATESYGEEGKATHVELKSVDIDGSTQGGVMKLYINSQTNDSILTVIYYGETGKGEYKFVFNKKLIEAERIDYIYEVPIYIDSKTKIRSTQKKTLETSKDSKDMLTEEFLTHKKQIQVYMDAQK